MAFAFNVRGPISVPVGLVPVVPRPISGSRGYAWLATLLITLGSSLALAQEPAPAALREPPGFSRIIVSPEGPVTLQGTAAPGDRIVLRLNGRQIAETRADAHGRWRLQLAAPLQPGEHTVTATAVVPGSKSARASDDVRIAIPDAAIPDYTDSDGPDDAVDLGPPNAATRRRAAELAREASREFSKLTAGKDERDPIEMGERQSPAADGADEVTDDSRASDTPATPDVLRPSHWFAVIAAWLERARHDYNEILVAGLSDPERRRGHELAKEDTPVADPPLPDRADQPASRIAGLAAAVVGWLQRANRDYHEYVVRELALRGIEDPQERRIARSAASAPDEITAPPSKDDTVVEPSSPGTGLDAEGQRVAEARRAELAEANRKEDERAAEARRLADERTAEERTRQREAAKAEARTRQLAEAQHQAQERKQEQEQRRQRSEQHAGNARIARALEKHLAERARQSSSAADEANRPKPPADPGEGSVPRTEAMPEGAEPSEKMAAQSDPAISDPPIVPPKARVAAAIPLPPRIDPAERARTAIVIPSRNERRVARFRQRADKPPLPSRAREKLRDPPLPTRAQVMPLQPPLPEPLHRLPAIAAKQDAPRRATAAERAQIIALPDPRPERVRSRDRHRHRWCNHPAAGRRIDPPGIYIVAYGDTLWDIAKRHYGAGYVYRRIQRANRRKIARSSRIYPCQRIWLPRMKRHRH